MYTCTHADGPDPSLTSYPLYVGKANVCTDRIAQHGNAMRDVMVLLSSMLRQYRDTVAFGALPVQGRGAPFSHDVCIVHQCMKLRGRLMLQVSFLDDANADKVTDDEIAQVCREFSAFRNAHPRMIWQNPTDARKRLSLRLQRAEQLHIIKHGTYYQKSTAPDKVGPPEAVAASKWGHLSVGCNRDLSSANWLKSDYGFHNWHDIGSGLSATEIVASMPELTADSAAIASPAGAAAASHLHSPRTDSSLRSDGAVMDVDDMKEDEEMDSNHVEDGSTDVDEDENYSIHARWSHGDSDDESQAGAGIDWPQPVHSGPASMRTDQALQPTHIGPAAMDTGGPALPRAPMGAPDSMEEDTAT